MFERLLSIFIGRSLFQRLSLFVGGVPDRDVGQGLIHMELGSRKHETSLRAGLGVAPQGEAPGSAQEVAGVKGRLTAPLTGS